MIKKILIANRGEIAVRIIRACKELGIETVAVYSTADENALHVQLATEAVCIGGPKAKDSYLNMQNVLSAACLTGCDAIHPGFGFLSENAAFARLVQKCGLIFIGPRPEVIEKMGDKAAARKLMIQSKVSVVPGSTGVVSTPSEGKKIAVEIGYPVLIKASAGGGGKGMRIATSNEDFEAMFYAAKSEAKNAFGDDSVYVEKLIENPKHIEVQILGDKYGNIIHLYERDCSMQRRKQKMLEEAPCFSITESVRKAIIDDAVKAAKAAKYDSAGTVEFVLDKNNKHYFIEMNTRIQVEHPITEMITGVDIVKQQIRIADKQPLTIKQEDVKKTGFAIECRINAEDIRNNFMPSLGKITFFHTPGGKGVRIDSAIYTGCEISPFYDSMILKVIAFAQTRLECIRKMRAALEELIVDGVKTNLELQYMILHHPLFVEGNYDTSFIEGFLKGLEESGEFI